MLLKMLVFKNINFILIIIKMRGKIIFPKMIHIKLENVNAKQHISSSSKIKSYIMFSSGILLAISESLPFMSDIKANGIIDAIKIIREQFKSLE
jgi:hypothetical protein